MLGTVIGVAILIIVVVIAIWLLIQLLPIDHDGEDYRV